MDTNYKTIQEEIVGKRKLYRSLLKRNTDSHKNVVELDEYIIDGISLKTNYLIDLDNIINYTLKSSDVVDGVFIKKIYDEYYPNEKKLKISHTTFELLAILFNDGNMKKLVHFIYEHNIFKNNNFFICSLLINRYYYRKYGLYYILPLYRKELFDKLIIRSSRRKFLSKVLEFDNKIIFTKMSNITIKNIEEKCLKIDREILDLLNVVKVFVFGSYATGKSTEYSDIDFMVLTDNINNNVIETSALLKKEFIKYFGNKINLVCVDVNKNISKFDIANLLTAKLVLDYANI